VFAISAGLAGIGGALYTPQSGIISPETMNIAFSIEMVIWVAVGGRASLVGAILGALVVNFSSSIFSEQFPAVWSFSLGALFLLVVLALPQGILGWFRSRGWEQLLYIFGWRKRSYTYPSLEEDPEVQYERKNIGN
jgi:urea transport system permease protein